MKRKPEPGVLARSAAIEAGAVDADARTVALSFSSEAPYDRWFGTEILDHGSGSVRLDRLRSGRHPLLVDHSTRDHVGVVQRAWIDDDRVGRAVVRFGNSARAQEIFRDVQDGIRTLMSVGYRVHTMVLASKDDEHETYRVTDWEPFEVSLVAVPADATVGVGRGEHDELIRSMITRAKEEAKEATMNDGKQDSGGTIADTKPAARVEIVDTSAAREAGTAAERTRVREITALGDRFSQRELATAAIEAGTSYDAFREQVFGKLQDSGTLRLAESRDVDLSRRDVERFSFCRAIAAAMFPGDAAVEKMAGFEIAVARAAADKRHDSKPERSGALHIPMSVLSRPLAIGRDAADRATAMLSQRPYAAGQIGQRDLVVGTPAFGGLLVATDLLAASFIDILVNEMAVMRLGATMLRDLSGHVAIPRAISGTTGFWVAENTAPTETRPNFDQVALTPRTCGAFTDYSRRLLLQSSIDVEAFVRMDLARTLALLIDLAATFGTGASNQPRGVANTVGIGSVEGGVNGLAPTWDHIVALETALANANAGTTTRAYLTNTRVRGRLKRTQLFGGTNGDPVWSLDGTLNGTRAEVSNQIPHTLTKGTSTGVCSAILYGNWSDLLIGLWGGLDILADPYTGSTAGTRRIVALQDVDVSVRYPVAFAAMLDALTV